MKDTQTKSEVFDLLPKSIQSTKELTIKRKNVLAQLIFLDNGMSDFKAMNNGWFFRDNKTLAKECSITEANLLPCLAKLQQMGFIMRSSGNAKNRTASYYKICWNNINTFGGNNSSNNSSSNSSTIAVQEVSVEQFYSFKIMTEKRFNDIENLLLLILNNSSYNSSSNNETMVDNNSIDIEIDKDIDIEIKIEKDLDLNNNKEIIKENITGAVGDTAPYEEVENFIDNTDFNLELKSDIIPSKEINNTAVQQTEVELQSENNNNKNLEQSPSNEEKQGSPMNAITKSKIYQLQIRYQQSNTVGELDDKRLKFIKYLDMLLDNGKLTQNEYVSSIQLVEELYKKTLNNIIYKDNTPTEEDEAKVDNVISVFFNNETKAKEEPAQAIEETQVTEVEQSKSNTKSKENIIEALNDFKQSLNTYENPIDALSILEIYGNRYDALIVEYGLLNMYTDLVNYVKNYNTNVNNMKVEVGNNVELTEEQVVEKELSDFKETMYTKYRNHKEANEEFHKIVEKNDSLIAKYNLSPMVVNIKNSLDSWRSENTSTNQNKALTDTFDTLDEEVKQMKRKSL